MTGEDFLSLAIGLSSSDREADCRSAVSRAYYGAFHVGFALLGSFGIQLPRWASAHDKLYQCLANSANRDLLAAAKILTKLRSERNLADNDLGASAFGHSDHARLIVRRATEILTAITTCDADSVRAPIREYARQVQRLPVTNE